MSAEEPGGPDRARSGGRPSRRTPRGRPDRRPTEQNRGRSDRPGRLAKCWTSPPLLVRRLGEKKSPRDFSGAFRRCSASYVRARRQPPGVRKLPKKKKVARETLGIVAGSYARGSVPGRGLAYFGKITGNTTSVVKMQRSLCPHSETMIAVGFASIVSVMYFTNASPRARLFGPCAIAFGDESNPPSGNTSTWPKRYVVGRSTSCFFNCSSDILAVYPVRFSSPAGHSL